jgi:dihydroneopterin aldolase
MDTIFIHELRLETKIGIYEWEKKVPQALELNLEIGLAGRHAADSGKIGDTIDYAAVVAHIRQLFAEQHYALLERAAEAVAAMLEKDFGAPWVRVSIAKLSALPGVKKLGVVIERGQKPGI